MQYCQYTHNVFFSTADYDILPERTYNTKTHKLSPSTIGVAEVVRDASQSNNTVRSNQSSGSYDYIQDPRRCVLEIDHNKGLGFVLSANNDYDHTITAVDKVCISTNYNSNHLFLVDRIQ